MKLIPVIACVAFSFLAVQAKAQVAKDVDTAVTKAADKTAQTASKTKSAVVDNKYKGKVGPAGQTIYIDHESKYYYVDKKGKKVYVPKSSLKDEKKS
jgi:hypothetical protein